MTAAPIVLARPFEDVSVFDKVLGRRRFDIRNCDVGR
jgi:hypothetical protein